MSTRENILKTIKKEMISKITTTQLDNISDVKEEINQLFEYAHYLSEIPNYLEPSENMFDKNEGVLDRKLINGYIQNQNGERIFIPESLIRKLQFKHGDTIHYKIKDQDSNGNKYYTYTKVKESIDTETNRQEFKQGLVERNHHNQLVITQSIHGDKIGDHISLESGEPVDEVVIWSEYINKYNIKENDTIDLAWYENNVKRTIRPIWKN